jgi:hypothetical protein
MFFPPEFPQQRLTWFETSCGHWSYCFPLRLCPKFVSPSHFIYLFFIIVLGRGILWHLQKFLWYINIPYLNSPPPSFSFVLHSWNSFNRYLFSIYIHVYTVFVPYSHSHTLSPSPPPSHCYQSPPRRTCSALLFCNFVNEKQMTVLFV